MIDTLFSWLKVQSAPLPLLGSNVFPPRGLSSLRRYISSPVDVHTMPTKKKGARRNATRLAQPAHTCASGNKLDDVDFEIRRAQLADAVGELAREQALPSVRPDLLGTLTARQAEANEAVADLMQANMLSSPLTTTEQFVMPRMLSPMSISSTIRAKRRRGRIARPRISVSITRPMPCEGLKTANNTRNEVAMASLQDATNSLTEDQNLHIERVSIQ